MSHACRYPKSPNVPNIPVRERGGVGVLNRFQTELSSTGVREKKRGVCDEEEGVSQRHATEEAIEKMAREARL